VQEGIHGRDSWPELQSQVLLGEEEFVEKLKDVLEDKKQINEIPRSQRYMGRPSLDNIFRRQKTKAQRNTSIRTAHLRQGYTLKEIADYLGIHYTTVSKVIAKAETNKK
jgi:hypothetical protein